jgi:predicted nuclease of restriction endonuclease-like RecB superfamily
VRPAWLEPRHDAWLRTMIEALDASDGATVAEADAKGDELALRARALGFAAPVVSGVWHVLRQWSRTEIAARIPPKTLRADLFAHAAEHSLEETLEHACSTYAMTSSDLRRSLYADLPAARVVRTKKLPTTSEVRDAYNMSLAQGLLGRCAHVTISADENIRAVVRAAKLRGLLVSIDATGPLLRASGPLALFRKTTKYAHALALFLPALVSHAQWSLEGDLVDGDTRAVLCLDATSPLPRTWSLPLRADSALESALIKALARSRSEWTLRREPLVFRAGRELFFPDFVLERGPHRVVVEIVGFWTPDYLERKMAQLATVTKLPLIVCVDESLACDPSRVSNADVLRFRRKLDASALIDAAERAIRAKTVAPP